MINRKIKQWICGTPLLANAYNWLVIEYKNYLRYKKCRQLRVHGKNILRAVDAALAGRADYFIDFGTLLGFAREKGFIRHDDDIDFSVKACSATPLAVYKAISPLEGFVFSHAFEFRGQITELTFKYHGIDVDFFFLYKRGDAYLHAAYDRFPEKFDYPGRDFWSATCRARHIRSIIRMPFLRIEVNVPANYEDFLVETYGTWRTPVVGWSGSVNRGQVMSISLNDFSRVVDASRVLEIGSVVIEDQFKIL